MGSVVGIAKILGLIRLLVNVNHVMKVVNFAIKVLIIVLSVKKIMRIINENA